MFEVSFDQDVCMVYAKLTDHDIVQTLTSEELGFKGINVDVDTDGRVVEEIWVDRTNMEIVRQVAYGEEGLELTDTSFSGYQVSGDAPFPQVVTIYRPGEDVNLKITFQSSPEANTGIPTDAFQLDPEGADVVQMPGQSAKP